MGWNDQIDWDANEAINELIEHGYLEPKTAAFGIAQQFVHSGYDSLSGAQKAIFDKIIGPALAKQAEKTGSTGLSIPTLND